MTGIPNPPSTTPSSLAANYDAWNRLVWVSDGATSVSQNFCDARGYRIRKDTYTSGTLTETRHYYYTPGWQCVEERVGTSTTLERQFVWGLRYIDDLVLRDRSTANNGVINERRYAVQDGNWNTIAICDITGFVGERYAYSAYGTPVFMTGAGVVQASSPIGFETLYAGYRWDGATPQMYYVRNRFLLPMIGTWNRRDPLGYVDGMALYNVSTNVSNTDPFGIFPPDEIAEMVEINKLKNGEMSIWFSHYYKGGGMDLDIAKYPQIVDMLRKSVGTRIALLSAIVNELPRGCGDSGFVELGKPSRIHVAANYAAPRSGTVIETATTFFFDDEGLFAQGKVDLFFEGNCQYAVDCSGDDSTYSDCRTGRTFSQIENCLRMECDLTVRIRDKFRDALDGFNILSKPDLEFPGGVPYRIVGEFTMQIGGKVCSRIMDSPVFPNLRESVGNDPLEALRKIVE